MTNSDKHNNLFAHAQLQNSVNKALNTIRNIAQISKETIGGVSTNRLLDVWKTLLIFSKYFSSKTFSQNIKYCSVEFSPFVQYSIKCIVHIKYCCIN